VAALIGRGSLDGPLAVEDEGNGLGRRVVHRRGVPEPGGVLGEAGEVWEANGVDTAVGAEDRVGRELVQHEHEHVRPPPNLRRLGIRVDDRLRGALAGMAVRAPDCHHHDRGHHDGRHCESDQRLAHGAGL
jgi:hypothetical protein